jgi:hypothetical protein
MNAAITQFPDGVGPFLDDAVRGGENRNRTPRRPSPSRMAQDVIMCEVFPPPIVTSLFPGLVGPLILRIR